MGGRAAGGRERKGRKVGREHGAREVMKGGRERREGGRQEEKSMAGERVGR